MATGATKYHPQQHSSETMPVMNDHPAIWLLARGADFNRIGSPSVGAGNGALGKRSENSATSAIIFHSVAPAACTLVWPLTRPSVIHCRSCSALTGPYSFWSAPIILYMESECLTPPPRQDKYEPDQNAASA